MHASSEIILAGGASIVSFNMSDEDVRTIHAVLARLRNEGRTAQSQRLTERTKAAVEQKMGIEPVAMPAHHFLRRVARDYAALDDTF